MKKTLTKVLTTVLACGLIFTAAACGGKNNDNAGKTAIKTSFFIGEFGDEWIKDLAKEWSANNDKYYIDVKNNLNLGGTIVADIKSNSSFDLFVAEDCAMQQLFAGDYKGLRHSLCHGWSSGVVPFFIEETVGLKNLEAGFKKISVTRNIPIIIRIFR